MTKRSGARGAGAVEYMAGVAGAIVAVLAGASILGSALRGGTTCEANSILAFESLCGRSGALGVGAAPAAAGPGVPRGEGALTCDKLGCRATAPLPIAADAPAA